MIRFALIYMFLGRLSAQDITIRMYSEFQRVSPLGEIVRVDRAVTPREVISPGAARNAYTSFHVAVTAVPGTIYYIATQSYPRGVVQMRLYKESFSWAGGEYIPDALTPVPESALRVGVMPDYNAPDASRSTEVYLLDVWVPAGTPPGVVRIEALVKAAYWHLAPIELRIARAIAPDIPVHFGPSRLSPVEVAADGYAWDALFEPGDGAAGPATSVRAVLRRNALQDAALAKRTAPDRFWGRIWSSLLDHGFAGAERYLPVRNYLLRNAN